MKKFFCSLIASITLAVVPSVTAIAATTENINIDSVRVQSVGDTTLKVELKGSDVTNETNWSQAVSLKSDGEYTFDVDTSQSGFNNPQNLSALPLYVVLEDAGDKIENIEFDVVAISCDVNDSHGIDILNKSSDTHYDLGEIDDASAFSLKDCVDAEALSAAMSTDDGSGFYSVDDVHLTINVTTLVFKGTVTTTTSTTTTTTTETTTTIETTTTSTSESTTSSSTSTQTTTTNETQPSTSSSTSKTTTTTSKPTSTTTTSSPNKQESVPTGDAGVGALAAAMALAGVTAYLSKKRGK